MRSSLFQIDSNLHALQNRSALLRPVGAKKVNKDTLSQFALGNGEKLPAILRLDTQGLKVCLATEGTEKTHLPLHQGSRLRVNFWSRL